MHPDMYEIGRLHTDEYLRLIGVRDLPPLTSPFDPGYDPVTLESHLDQSAHLMSILGFGYVCDDCVDRFNAVLVQQQER